MKPTENHVVRRLAAHLAGELDPEIEIEVCRHLDSCPDCRDACRTMEQTLAALEGLNERTVTPGASAWPSIRDRTFGEATQPQSWFFGGGRASRGLLASTAVAAGLAMGILFPVWRPAEPVDATAEELTAELWADSSLLSAEDAWTSGLAWLELAEGEDQ